MPTVFRPNRLASYDEDSILAEISRVINDHFHGKPPGIEEFEKLSLVKGNAIRRHFGSWGQAVQKAGFDYKGKNYENIDLRRPRFNKELMIADLQRVKQLNGGKYFSRSFYRENGGQYSADTLKKHFKLFTWQALLEKHLFIVPPGIQKIRIKKQKFKRVSQFNEDGPPLLMTELENLGQQDRKGVLTFAKYREIGGSFSIKAFRKHFGSWRAAVEKIGRGRGQVGKYSDEELFTEMQRLWEKYGRQPTFKEMNKYGGVRSENFIRRFGSWMKAIHAFCDDRDSGFEKENYGKSSPLMIVGDPSQEPESLGLPPVQPEESIPPKTEIILLRTDEPIYTHTETVLLDSRRLPSLRLRFRVMQRDGFRCLICGRSPANHLGLELQIDHIIPYSQGGPTALENLRTLCKDCNLGKSDTMP
jgi:hypothetical protein